MGEHRARDEAHKAISADIGSDCTASPPTVRRRRARPCTPARTEVNGMNITKSVEAEIGCDVPVERRESKGVNPKINQVLDEYEECKKRQCAAEVTA